MAHSLFTLDDAGQQDGVVLVVDGGELAAGVGFGVVL